MPEINEKIDNLDENVDLAAKEFQENQEVELEKTSVSETLEDTELKEDSTIDETDDPAIDETEALEDSKTLEHEVSEELTLEEVCEVCSKYYLGEIDKEDFTEWLGKVRVVPYLPILDKMSCLSYLLFKASFDEDEDPEWQIFGLEQYKFWDILLRYTNIKTEGYNDYKTITNYDSVFSSLGDYILLHCFNDYNRLIQMFDSTINIYNIKNLLKVFAGIDQENISKTSEELNKELEILSKHGGTIDKLAEILINKPNK